MAVESPSWILVHPLINIRKINRLPGELFKKVSRRMPSSKRRNNQADLRRTHSASAKNCFQARPRSLYGVNYLLMRDVLVTFMYVPLAGGQLRARSTGLTQPRGPQRPGPDALLLSGPVFVRLLARTGGFSDPTRRLLRRRMSSARAGASAQNRQRAQTTPGLGRDFGGSEGLLGWRGRAVELHCALSRSLLGEKLRSFLEEKWRRGSRCRGHFMDITLGDCYAWKTGVEPLFVTNILQSLFLTDDLGLIVYIIY